MSPTQKTPEAQEVMNEWIEQALTQKRNDLFADLLARADALQRRIADQESLAAGLDLGRVADDMYAKGKAVGYERGLQEGRQAGRDDIWGHLAFGLRRGRKFYLTVHVAHPTGQQRDLSLPSDPVELDIVSLFDQVRDCPADLNGWADKLETIARRLRNSAKLEV